METNEAGRIAATKFNRWYMLINTDPNVAVRVLTLQVMATMRQLKPAHLGAGRQRPYPPPYGVLPRGF